MPEVDDADLPCVAEELLVLTDHEIFLPACAVRIVQLTEDRKRGLVKTSCDLFLHGYTLRGDRVLLQRWGLLPFVNASTIRAAASRKRKIRAHSPHRLDQCRCSRRDGDEGLVIW